MTDGYASDHPGENGAVAITGVGAITAYGAGVQALWQAIEEGRDGIQSVRRFPTDMFSNAFAAQVPGFPVEMDFSFDTAPYALARDFAMAAVTEAWAAAGVDAAGVRPERIGIVSGTLRGHRCGYHDSGGDHRGPSGDCWPPGQPGHRLFVVLRRSRNRK